MTAAIRPLRLENAYFRAEVDSSRGGAVAELRYKKAAIFPVIAGRGAGVAGRGVLFAPWVEIDGAEAEMKGVVAVAGNARFRSFSGELAPGLFWERSLQTGRGESGFSLRDRLRNASGRSVLVRLGMESRQEGSAWRLTDRCLDGDQRSCLSLLTSSLPVPGSPPPATRRKFAGASFFWRQIGQYGTGLLYRIQPGRKGEGGAEVLAEEGNPVRVEWRSAAIPLADGRSVELAAEVLVDEGGGAPDQRNGFGRVLVRSDMAAAGRRGEPLIGFATVVSARRRRIRVAMSIERERRGHGDPPVPGPGGSEHGGKSTRSATLTLMPGRVARVPVVFRPAVGGRWVCRAIVTERGQRIAAAESVSVIDGRSGQPVWRSYAREMPEENYRGTWREIGEQMARNPRRIGGPTSIEYTVGEVAAPDNDIAFYRQHLPFYAQLTEGMARVAGAAPERLGLVKRGQRDKPVACMDVACYGPDGPINAFSKERDGPDFEGLGYVKVVPAEGYAFHTYMHHGVNSAGLSVSGATLNEDEATARAAHRRLRRWKAGGRHTMPAAAATWMLLAMCRDLAEALALMENPVMPWEMTGNLLLLDRSGRAARVECSGLDRQVFRHDGRGRRFFVAGNYPHERADGRFRLGARWGHAANTLLRERFLRDFAGDRQGRLGLPEVLSLMQCHEAGGMCQHHHDNPGQLYTVCSSLAVTRTSELWLSHGPPCRVQYVRYRLDS